MNNFNFDKKKWKNFAKILDDFEDDKKINNFLKENTNLSKEIGSDVNKWLKETNREILINNPYYDESVYIKSISDIDEKQFQAEFKKIKNKLKKFDSDIDIEFYEQKLEKILNEKISRKAKKKDKLSEKLKPLKKLFFEDLIKQLKLKEDNWIMKQIDEARKKFLQELYRKIDEFSKIKEILSPFTNDLGRLWDMSSGVWQNTGFDILKKYADILQNDKDLRELAELLGRMRSAEKEYEEELIKAFKPVQKYKINRAGKAEVVGVYESDDLNNLLPSEIALLANPQTENIFYKRFAEKKLQTFQFIDKESYVEQKEYKKKVKKEKEEDKGPVILAIDTSGSMHGTPEHIAKVITFAIVKIALEEDRKVFLISFSTSINTIELTDLPNSLDKLVNFLRMSFHGGTDPTPALREGVRQMKSENYKKADLIMISDFIMNNLSSDIVAMINEARKEENKFYALTISSYGNENAMSDFDETWVYNQNDSGSMKRLIRKLKEFRDK